MKPSWGTPIAMASLVLTLLTLVMNMNRVSADDARRIEARLSVLEQRVGTAEKAGDRTDARQDQSAATMADLNLRIDRLERTQR